MSPLEFLEFCCAYWLVLVAVPFVGKALKLNLALPLVLGYVAFLILNFEHLADWQRLCLASVGLLFTLKTAWLQNRLNYTKSSAGSLILAESLYMTLWPGFDFDALTRREKTNEDGAAFVAGYVCFWLGLLLLLSAAMLPISITCKSWLGIFAILLMVHFGYAVMLGCLIRCFGFNVRPLFDRPELAESLRDFWGRRWNMAFVDMNKQIFVPWFAKHMGMKQALLATFLLSGLLHDLAISYPAGSGFGFPTLYFVIQASGILIEKRQRRFFSKHRFVSRMWTYGWVLLPLPLLFTEAFRMQFILPVVQQVTDAFSGLSPMAVLSLALWLAGIGHFCTLFAGLQVPFRFNWKEELSRLSRFNQKIMLNYAGYVGMIIVAFGYLTLKLHNEFLYGDKTCINLAGLIAVFWIVRLLVDFFYFHHDDWPKGPEFVIGHTCLVSLFLAMAGVYSFIVIINCFPIVLRPWL